MLVYPNLDSSVEEGNTKHRGQDPQKKKKRKKEKGKTFDIAKGEYARIKKVK